MDNRRLLLSIIFFVSIFMLWEAWNRQHAPQPVAGSAAQASAQSGAPVPSASLQAGVTAPAGDAASQSAAEKVTVTTDLFKAEISSQGGDLVRLELLKHKSADENASPDHRLVLIDPAHRYEAQTGLIGDNLPTHRSTFKVLPGKREMAEGSDTLTLSLEADTANGVKVIKTYTFHRDSYVIDVGYEIDNHSQAAVAPHAYFQLQRDETKPAGEARMVSTFTGPAFYSAADKYQKVDFSDIEKDKAKHVKTADNGWVAMVQHYFVTTFLPQGNVTREFYTRKVGNGAVAAGVILPVQSIAPGAKGGITVPMYAGPQVQSELKKLADGLDLVVDYGWLTIIAAPLFWVLQALHKLTGNWGWAIILLTIGLKLLFFPLSAASYKSMAKMRQVTPRLTQIKERFGDDRQRMNQEMMELYKKEKINPLGGCLPIVVQIPVFIALYWVLLGAVEMRQAPWLGWITDLSVADPFYILPVFMMVTMLIQTKLNPTPPDPIQAKVMWMMPLVFGVMFFFFPAGLVLYWTVNNLLSIAQQWSINRMMGDGKAAKA
ncbi:membrane protein insertase YidC [Oryzomicrobium sp.]|uniref:membrane protein insertase YidC n=1 Tax=Oryzomicrobium sp. TaxID=1911578 RepID=UPI0025E4E34F|nr:membrane protein insertase YidC [Oryzomicrobium sp.]MCE1242267.1 membrane protein insertase YidC [Oryzomicrobium sp.]